MPGEGRRFQPGNPGGPGGARPGSGAKPKAVRQAEQELLDAAIPDEKRVKLLKTLYAIATRKDADDGDRIAAAKVLLERIYGRPTGSVEMSGPNGAAIAVGILTRATVTTEQLAEMTTEQLIKHRQKLLGDGTQRQLPASLIDP